MCCGATTPTRLAHGLWAGLDLVFASHDPAVRVELTQDEPLIAQRLEDHVGYHGSDQIVPKTCESIYGPGCGRRA